MTRWVFRNAQSNNGEEFSFDYDWNHENYSKIAYLLLNPLKNIRSYVKMLKNANSAYIIPHSGQDTTHTPSQTEQQEKEEDTPAFPYKTKLAEVNHWFLSVSRSLKVKKGVGGGGKIMKPSLRPPQT